MTLAYPLDVDTGGTRGFLPFPMWQHLGGWDHPLTPSAAGNLGYGRDPESRALP